MAANIEVYLDGSGHKSTLEDSVASLRRGMMACKERQVYLKLVSGEYVPRRRRCLCAGLESAAVLEQPRLFGCLKKSSRVEEKGGK